MVKKFSCYTFYILFTCSYGFSLNSTLSEMLKEKFKYVNDELDGDHVVSRKDTQKHIDFHNFHTITLPKNYVSAHSFTLYNRTYTLLDMELYYIIPKDGSYIMSDESRSFARFEDEVSFIEVTEFNGNGFLLVVFKNGVSNVYHLNNAGNNRFVQSIENPVTVKDAKFFIQKQQLYLIISTVKESSSMPTTLYVWLTTYFDEIEKIQTKGAVGLLTFSNGGDSEIIVLLQNSPKKRRSIIYEFSYSHLKKMQILKTEVPKHIITLKWESRRYVIIFDELFWTMYWWDGSELVKVAKWDHPPRNIERAISTKVNSIPIIFVLTKNELFAYTPSNNKLELLNKFDFVEPFTLPFYLGNNKDEIFIIGQTRDQQLNITVVDFSLDLIKIESNALNKDQLSFCLGKLEELLNSSQTELNLLERKSKKILQVNEPAEFDGRLNVAAPVVAQIFPQTPSDKIQQATNKVEELLTAIQDMDLNVNGKLIIKGELRASKLETTNLKFEKLNSITWSPANWWSYTKEQTIIGSVTVKNLITDELWIPGNGTIFDDVLLDNGSQKLSGFCVAKSLSASKLFTPTVNKIHLEDVYLRNNPRVIKGLKHFGNLSVKDMKITSLNDHNIADIIKLFASPKSQRYDFAPVVFVTDLYVDYLNNLDWKEFKESVFLTGKTNAITGSLSLVGGKINKLYVKALNDMLTTTSNQIITSNIKFTNIDATNINCGRINDINISNESVAVTDGDGNFVKGLVIIDNFHVVKLNLNGERISGPEDRDLLQIYNSKIKIMGSLHLENVALPNNTKVVVNGRDFNLMNFVNNFWLKSFQQIIPVHVEMQNGITTPHLVTNSLNDIAMGKYMLNNADDKLATKFNFENATVIGNIVIDESKEHQPNLTQVAQDAVKLKNGEYEIKGMKYFNGKLTIDNLVVNYLDNIDVSNAATVKSDSVLGSKSYEKLIVRGNLTTKNANINSLDGVNLHNIYNETLLIDRNIYFDNMEFENVTIENLQSRKINNKIFNEYILTIDKIHELQTMHNLKVVGNVNVKNIQNISSINGVKTDKLTENIARGNAVKTNAKFMNHVHIKHLVTSVVNNIDYEGLTKRLFYRKYPQKVTGRHTFKIVRTPNLFSPAINNFDLNSLIDTRSYEHQVLPLRNDLRLKRATFLKSLNANLFCNIKDVAAKIRAPPTRFWTAMHVLKNISIMDESESLNYLLKNAVTTNRKNVITAPVTFTHISTRSVESTKHINGVDIADIYGDALIKSENDQLVTGFKKFTSMTAAGASVAGNAQIPVINELIMTNLNENIIRKNDINNVTIRGRKTFFGGLETTFINTPTILGLNPENLVSTRDRRLIPHAVFDSLHVLNNFDTDFVNNVNFTAFILERLLKNCPNEQLTDGTYYFGNIHVIGNSYMSEINQIKLDDVVFDFGIQIIPSPKTFTQNAAIYGDAQIELLNDIDVHANYKQSILFNEEAIIEGDVIFSDIIQVNGDVIAQNIRNISADFIKALLGTEAPKIKANITRDTIQKIEDIVVQNVDAINHLPSKYMYLEKSDDLEISIPNTTGAQIIQSNGQVMIHVIGEEGGQTCGLPENCSCPKQHTIRITPEHSIYNFPSKGLQRIYSYENDQITIHVATSSLSSNEFCRSNFSDLQENTTLIWSVKSNNNTGQHFVYSEFITGFIRGAEFFSLDGFIYVVIGRFYDPVINTYNLDCLVFRFTREKDNVELVQKISTKGSWTLHLFQTAQGTNLIIGNIFDSDHINGGSGTDIYRFDPLIQQFTRLRSILGAGCISATGVVLESDSLIILAQKNSPMLVFKYDHFYDNYYFYQHFVLESPVLEVSVFYARGFGSSDAYLCAVTESNNFYIYSYQHVQGWKLESRGKLEGVRSLVPFTLNKETYLFAASTEISSVLTVVKYG